MANGKGPFGGYKTRREQMEAQERAAGAVQPEEPEEMEPAPVRRNGNGMDNGNGMRRKRDNYPWD